VLGLYGNGFSLCLWGCMGVIVLVVVVFNSSCGVWVFIVLSSCGYGRVALGVSFCWVGRILKCWFGWGGCGTNVCVSVRLEASN